MKFAEVRNTKRPELERFFLQIVFFLRALLYALISTELKLCELRWWLLFMLRLKKFIVRHLARLELLIFIDGFLQFTLSPLIGLELKRDNLSAAWTT